MPYSSAAWPYLLVALAVAIVATAWVWRRRGRSGPSARSPDKAGAPAAPALTAREFEARVGRSFQAQGFQLVGTGPDGHADLVLRRERQTYLVTCKHWQTVKVGVEAVQALQRAMAARGAVGGFMLTTGRFGREAVALAGACNVRLIGGDTLHTLLAQASAPAAEADPATPRTIPTPR
jgi:restriction system protein